MKIVEINSLPLARESAPYSGERGADPGQMHVLLEVLTDEGVSGLGSVYTRAPLVSACLEVLRDHVVGLPAHEPTRVRETLDQLALWEGHGGAVSHVLSGIDIALWDILGKVSGQPISRLLGGRFRERVKPYASILMAEPKVMAERVAAVVERGFRGVKIGWGPFGAGSREGDEAIVRAARDAAGPQVAVMVDAGGSDPFWPKDRHWAAERSRMLSDYDVVWFEEPLKPDDLDGHRWLSRQATVPVAGCEVLCRRQEFLPWIERRAVDVIQPDTTRVGGISEAFKIASYALDHGIQVAPHGWNTAVGLAADLQIIAALAQGEWVEYVTPSPFIDGLLETAPVLDAEGKLEIPDGPGLGVAWNRDGIERYTGRRLSE